MYIIGRFLITSVLVLLFQSSAIRVSTAHSESMSQPVPSQDVGSLARFSSVELRNGGKAILRYGPVQRVTLLKGSANHTQITASGDRLTIDKCTDKCPRGYELEIEIVAPHFTGISIADGGTIEGRGSFPRRTEIRVAVRDGGAIDIRSMAVDSVTASVDQGGLIFTKPQSALIASVHQGGMITYWGDAQVISSIRHGGVITKGTANEEDKPLSDFSPSFSIVPPIPPVPPAQNERNLFR